MKEKFPEIYKNKIDKIKSSVQKEFYVHKNTSMPDKIDKISRIELIKKLNEIFESPNFVYQADITILYKNGENIKEKVIGIKDDYLITLEGNKINLNDIYNIK